MCFAAGELCANSSECCSESCSAAQRCTCISDGQSCTSDSECCGGVCNGTCTALNATCKTAGNSCTAHAECCSKYCHDNVCAQPSFCAQLGDACTTDASCCSGLCSRANGALFGLCTNTQPAGTPNCAIVGQVCGDGASFMGNFPACGGECCGHVCAPYGPTTVLVCQPSTGCREVGDVCYRDQDCCGGPGNPDSASNVRCIKEATSPVGRCGTATTCTPAGTSCKIATSSCNTQSNCCSGASTQVDSCRPDVLGVARCLATAALDCANPSSRVGAQCATTADCCNLPCLPTASGFACAGQCSGQGASCTTTADCCVGLPCNLAAGATQGTCGSPQSSCSQFGQSCTTNSQCCNGVPCSGGFCRPSTP